LRSLRLCVKPAFEVLQFLRENACRD